VSCNIGDTAMQPPRIRRLLVGPALAGLLLPCGCHYQLEGDYDPFRCDPACSGGKVCYQGRCVAADGGADGPGRDAAADVPLSDTVDPDMPDAGTSDGPADASGPVDTALPDVPLDTKPPADSGSADGPVIWLDLGATDMPKPIIDGWPPHLGCQSHAECVDPTSPCCCPMPLLPGVWSCLPMCVSPFCI
jgi:hypothetical protein